MNDTAKAMTFNEVLEQARPGFLKADMANGQLLDWTQECIFAKQLVTKNDFILKVAQANPSSLKNAIYNVAAIGISLNPAMSHAYLVPRDGGICLDVSYRGLVYLATECGAIQWAKTELVYANDTFVWRGMNKEPEHAAEVFSDRGEVVGGYCIAKLPDGSVMVEIMSRAEMDEIEMTSKAKNGPWKNWKNEMRKKSVTKRASKSWPQTGDRKRFDTAVEVINEHEGLTEEEKGDQENVLSYTAEDMAEYQRCVDEDDYFNLEGLVKSLDYESQLALERMCFPEPPKGRKMKMKNERGAKWQRDR